MAQGAKTLHAVVKWPWTARSPISHRNRRRTNDADRQIYAGCSRHCCICGLAILGWGGFAAFCSRPAWVALLIVLLALSGVALFAGGNLSSGVREDRSNRWVIGVFALIGLLDAHLLAQTDRKEFWTIGGNAIRWFAVGLFAVGGALRIWPVFVLRRRFSGLVAIQPGPTLVTSGVYSVIRHPSYLGLMINSLGWGLAFRSGVGVLLMVLLIPALIARIHAEERRPAQAVCRRVRCLLPAYLAVDSGS